MAPTEDVAGGLVTLLSVAVVADGTIDVAQNFAGVPMAVPSEGAATPVHSAARDEGPATARGPRRAP